MNTFPLIKTKWSNERVMAAVFSAAALYMLPGWVRNPASILGFMLVLSVGLAIDVGVNYLRHKRPVCAVSAAVTVAILQALTQGVPLWGELLAVAVALLAGKHIWGGTGKNPVNPAMVGLLFLSLFFRVQSPAFEPSLLLLPALLLSLPFLLFRPFAAAGMMAGMVASLLLNQSYLADVLSYGVIFWGCLVIADPVTTTSQPLPGALAGLLAGFVPMVLGGTTTAMALGILAANGLSFVADKLCANAGVHLRLSFKDKERIPFSQESTLFFELAAGNAAPRDISSEGWTRDVILARIERNGVFGFGGAAFPTIRKIKAVLDAKPSECHLIVNGVECDPGLIHDKWLLRVRTNEIAQGIRLLEKCLPFRSVTVAVKDDEGIHFPYAIVVRRVPDYYPAGAEKALIKEILHKSLPHDAIPAKDGILVLNVQTVFAIYEAVCLDRKADTRFITVADVNRMSASVVRVRLGMTVRDIVEELNLSAGCVFSGGGVMNARIAADDDTVDQFVNFLAVGMLPNYGESPNCSRCRLCCAVCPVGLKVNDIAELVDNGKAGETGRLHPERCLACGSCSHVCLAGRNLAARMDTAKASVKNAVS